jgi:HK97 family phage prohead protease
MSETDKTVERGHFTMKAVATVTDEGVFEAVISTASIDREKDIVEPAGMVAALKRWNRPIPLAWNHSTDAEDIIGSVEPMTAREVAGLNGGEVVVQGTVDLESKRGGEAWRSFKSGTIGFSYGYLVPEGGAKAREGGGSHITELDVFEITATPTPMNNDTRVLSVKAMEDRVEALERRITELEGSTESLETSAAAAEKSADPLEEATRQAVREHRLDGIPERKSPQVKHEPAPEPPTEADLRDEFRDLTIQLIRES